MVAESKQKELIEGYVRQMLELEDELELVEVIHSGNSVVKVFIYRPEGVTIEDCTRINRRLVRALEHDEEVPAPPSIEVSSPGLDRRLYSKRDFERVIGEHVRLEVTADDGKSSNVMGLLTDVSEEELLLEPPVEKKKRKSGSGKEVGPFRVALARVREGRIEVIF
ncbi:ribosome maturation factor RimP [Candidatus Zixiibacteriota bacterium]